MFALKTLITLASEITRHAQTWFGPYNGIDPILLYDIYQGVRLYAIYTTEGRRPEAV